MADLHLQKDITTNGAITFTGNTMGLSKKVQSQDAGTTDSIGAMITTQTFLGVPTYPTDPKAGTTLQVSENASFAFLNLPTFSTVLYAILIWGGSYKTANEDNSNLYKGPVTLITPLGTNQVSAQSGDIFTFVNDASSTYYFSYADVTNIIIGMPTGSNKIICEEVTGTTDPLNDAQNACGWTLGVIYQNPLLPSRNMTIYTGDSDTFVKAGGNIVENTVTGFTTPSSGPVNVRLLATALEGDANKQGDYAAIYPSITPMPPLDPYNKLYGPNNPQGNFFCSQINDDSGNVDTTGSFGNRNQLPFNPPGTANIVAGRQGWDITNIDGNATPIPASNANFVNNQTSTTLRFATDSDGYWVTGVGLQIDINSPVFISSKERDKPVVSVGDTIHYTLTFTNDGTAPTDSGAVITDSIPAGTTYANNLTVTFIPVGNSFTGDPINGIIITDPIEVGDIITVEFDVTVTAIPENLAYVNNGKISYTFNEDEFEGESQTNDVISITIRPFPPFVPNQTVTTCKNTTVSGQLNGNNPSGASLSYTLNSNPSHGVASVDANGKWIYTPFVGFVGTDSFTVLATSADGGTAIVTITINVLDKLCCELSCNQCGCNGGCC